MFKGSGGGALSYIKFVRFWFLQPYGLTTASASVSLTSSTRENAALLIGFIHSRTLNYLNPA